MTGLAALFKDWGLAGQLRELRLLRGQPGYRYCMAWGLVLLHLSARGALLWWVIDHFARK